MPVNFDANATYGLLPAVETALIGKGLSCLNPSSIHAGGQHAKVLLEEARDSVRKILSMPRDGNVVFTSGATEANNTALLSPYISYLSVKERISSITPSLVLSAVEHPSVLEAANRLESFGVIVHKIAPGKDGSFSPDDFAAKIEPHTKLVSVMTVNNETGQILPVRDIADAVRKVNPRVLVHTDAVQALGKISVSLEDLGADLMSFSGHKIGSLAGIGALVYRDGVQLAPHNIGGSQEVRRRAGTENLVGAISFGLACEAVYPIIRERHSRMQQYVSRIIESVTQSAPQAKALFSDLPSVGNTISLHVPGVNNGDLVVSLDLAGIYVSTGSACASGKPQASSTLQTMHISSKIASETVRISVAAEYDEREFQKALSAMTTVIRRFLNA